jgi:CRISPR-associated protein Cas2
MASDFLIAYDITCPRRLARMHRYLTKVAVPIEYSVFFVTGEIGWIMDILAEAANMIDKRSDDLRCYPLPGRGLKTRLGRATLPQGVFYSDLPAAWMGAGP